MMILTLNCGSSSLKYQVYDWDRHDALCLGMVERIGQESSRIEHQALNRPLYATLFPCASHKEAVSRILEVIQSTTYGVLSDIREIKAVGHRIVHGGEEFKKSMIIVPEVLASLEKLATLAPLHNPANVLGVRAAQAVLPEVCHCGVLDTAWHQTMPAPSYLYPLPYEWYKTYHLRRYGFHGTSHLYTAKRAAVLLGKKPSQTNLITVHIGNGASICAIKEGMSFDTSMGLTPLEGLMMGTRSGDIDPAIPKFIMDQTGCSIEDMDAILNRKSGVLGISQHIDRRDVQAGADKGDRRCILAQDLETYRIKKYIGSYVASLGRVDAIVFTAGVGVMNPYYREKALSHLEVMGILLDEEKNRRSRSRHCETLISDERSPTKLFVIPTDEEIVMTEDAYALLKGTYDIHTTYRYCFEDFSYVNSARERALVEEIAENPALSDIIVRPAEKAAPLP